MAESTVEQKVAKKVALKAEWMVYLMDDHSADYLAV